MRLRLFLFVFIVVYARALVAVPERRQSTIYQRPSNILYLENSPLLGGPSWLPIHVKVVLERDETVYKWDFIPENATDISNLQRLVSLNSVPAKIRFQTAPLRKPNDSFVRSGADMQVVVEKTFFEGNSTDQGMLDSKERTDVLLQTAQNFCDQYRTDIHLTQNNCWTFATQLYDLLYELDSNTK